MTGTRDMHPLTHCINSMAGQSITREEIDSLLTRTYTRVPSLETKDVKESPLSAAMTTINPHAVLWLLTKSKHPKHLVSPNTFDQCLLAFLSYEDLNEEAKDSKNSQILAKRKLINCLIDEAVDCNIHSGHIEQAVNHKNYYFVKKLTSKSKFTKYVRDTFINISKTNLRNLPTIVKLCSKEIEIWNYREEFGGVLNQSILNNDGPTALHFIEGGVCNSQTVKLIFQQANVIGIPSVIQLIRKIQHHGAYLIFGPQDWRGALKFQNLQVLKELCKFHSYKVLNEKINWDELITETLIAAREGEISSKFFEEIVSLIPANWFTQVSKNVQALLMEIGKVDLVRSLKCAKSMATKENLLKAVILGHTELAIELIINGAPLNMPRNGLFSKSTTHCPALEQAVEIGNFEMVKRLINQGAYYDHITQVLTTRDYGDRIYKDALNRRERIRLYIWTLIEIGNEKYDIPRQICLNMEKEDKLDLYNLFKGTDKEDIIKNQVIGSGFLELFPMQRPPAEAVWSEPEVKKTPRTNIPVIAAIPPDSPVAPQINWHGDEKLPGSVPELSSHAKGDQYSKLVTAKSSQAEARQITPSVSSLVIKPDARPLPQPTPVQAASARLELKSEVTSSATEELEPGSSVVKLPLVSSQGIFHQPQDVQDIRAEITREKFLHMFDLADQLFKDRPDLQAAIFKACQEELSLFATKEGNLPVTASTKRF